MLRCSFPRLPQSGRWLQSCSDGDLVHSNGVFTTEGTMERLLLSIDATERGFSRRDLSRKWSISASVLWNAALTLCVDVLTAAPWSTRTIDGSRPIPARALSTTCPYRHAPLLLPRRSALLARSIRRQVTVRWNLIRAACGRTPGRPCPPRLLPEHRQW